MRKNYAIKRKFSIKTSGDVARRVVDFLRRRHPGKTAEAVSAETGIAISTTRKWMEGSNVPGGIAFLRLIAAYGPEFLVAVMHRPPTWLDAAARAAEQSRLRGEIEALQRRLEST